MMDYKNQTDEELVCVLRDGENSVTDYLLDKYKALVRVKAGSLNILGADKEDLIQEGMIGLYKAIRDYDPGRDASFSTFAELCISRQMYTAVKNSNRKKHLPLNNYISFENRLNDSGENSGDGLELLDTLAASENTDPEKLLINKERIERLQQLMEDALSVLEYSVLELHMTGMSTSEIARILGRDSKSTDNALQRARTKMKRKLEAL